MSDDPMVCGKCGLTHERCTAHNREGLPCGRWPTTGHRVCRKHGAASPQAVKAADKRVAEAKAEKELNRLGLRKEGLTATALLQEVVERAGADLEFVASKADDPKWAAAYESIIDRAARVAKAGVDSGIAERAQALDEVVAVGILEDLRASFAEADADPEITQRVLSALGPRLRARAIGQ